MGYEFNLTTIAAFLTLIGYSVNDTVVTFDRVRENMSKHRGRNLLKVLNDSLNQMLSRTLLTGGTTIFASLMLFLFGGDVIKGFAFIMLVGIIVGTYSSIYIASPFALFWEEWFGASAQEQGRREARAAPAALQGAMSRSRQGAGVGIACGLRALGNRADLGSRRSRARGLSPADARPSQAAARAARPAAEAPRCDRSREPPGGQRAARSIATTSTASSATRPRCTRIRFAAPASPT